MTTPGQLDIRHRVLIIATVFLRFATANSSAQELVPNPGFEDHSPFCVDCSYFWPTKSFEYLKDWSQSGLRGAFYCNTVQDKPFMKEIRCCYPFVKPHSGNGMVRLRYIESCPVPPTGCTSYLHAKLDSVLRIGEVYEISLWVYFPENEAMDSTILTNIGFYLSRRPENPGSHTMIETEYFFALPLVTDKWVEVKYSVRALCAMQHLTIGAFRNADFPTTHRRIDTAPYFFIDDVSVRHIDERFLDSPIDATPYCEYYVKHERAADAIAPQDTSIYFESNSAALDDHDMATLNRFYHKTNGNPKYIYMLSGHTDNRGSENQELSLARTNAVEQYLKETYALSQFKFVSFAMGSQNPDGNNSTEAGRQENRKVTIRNSNIATHAAVYRDALMFVKTGELDQALRMFKIWLKTVHTDKRMAVLHDERLKDFLTQPQGYSLIEEVKKTYDRYVKPEAAFFLDSLYYADQRYRTMSLYDLTGYIPGLDTFHLTTSDKASIDFDHHDESVRKKLLMYLEHNGFPEIAKVGRRQTRAVSLILIHSEDTVLMRRYLPILETRCKDGEAEWDCYALLFDRLQVNLGLPQKYGTQKVFTDETRSLTRYAPMDDLDIVNLRRRNMGLHPLSEHDIRE